MRRWWFAATCLLGAANGFRANAQELEIAISPSPVGSGARAAGMADAFVALADDATAASWNPAGLVQLERPELSIVGSYNGLFEWFSADYHDEVDSRQSDNNVDLNFLSVTYPVPMTVLDRNISLGLYYQRKYDFSRKFTLQYNPSRVAPGDYEVLNEFQKLDFEQEGGLSALTGALAFELTNRLSLGVALNYWHSSPFSDNSWTQTLKREEFAQKGSSLFDYYQTFATDKYEDFEGVNYSFGLMWNISDKWSFGARHDTAFTGQADFTGRSHSTAYRLAAAQTGDRPLEFGNSYVREQRDVRFPPTWAAGIAYRPNDRLTFSCDVTTTDWNEFFYEGRDRNRISLVNAANMDDLLYPATFERTYTFRVGAEYVFLPKHPEAKLDRLWTIRGGVFADQEPAKHEPDNFWGFAAGVGLQLWGRVNIDAAYQLRAGNDVNSDFVRGIHGFDEDVIQNRFLISTVIYF